MHTRRDRREEKIKIATDIERIGDRYSFNQDEKDDVGITIVSIIQPPFR